MRTEALDLLRQINVHLAAYQRITGRPALWDLEVLEKLKDLDDDGEITVTPGKALKTIVEQAPELLDPDTQIDGDLFGLVSDTVRDAADAVGIRTEVEDG